MSRQSEKAENSRGRLMAAASELFAERSIDKVGVREICAKAGVTTGAFYHYYESKDEILDHLYRDWDEAFGVRLRKMLEAPPFSNQIVVFFTDCLAEKVEKDGIDFTRHRIFRMRKHTTEDMQLYIGMTELIAHAIDAGELAADCSAEEINRFLFLVFRGLIYEWCIAEDDVRFELKSAVRAAVTRALRAYRSC